MESEVASVDLKAYEDQASGTTKESVNVLYHPRRTVAMCHLHTRCTLMPEQDKKNLCVRWLFS